MMPIIVIKTINRCNSNCIYCFSEKDKQLNRISLATIKDLFFRILEYLQRDSERRIEIQWHGGEPLLLGAEFYQKIALLQNSVLGKYQENIEHTMQSNLTLLNQPILNALLLLKVKSVGTSVDPISGIRGIGKYIDSKIYLKKFLRGISFLESIKINWGINYVVTKNSLKIPKEIFYFLTNVSLFKPIVFNPVKGMTSSADKLKITPRQYTSFLADIYSIMKVNNGLNGCIEPIHSMELAADKIFHNTAIEEKAQEIPVVLDGKGNFYYYRIPDNPLGNIYQNNFSTILIKNEYINASIIDREKDIRNCLKCVLWNVCIANTINDPFSQNEEFKNLEWCYARKKFVLDFLLDQKKDKNG
jgi:sulfatase maturation enzyme AslB (radical SAM superfamily)